MKSFQSDHLQRKDQGKNNERKKELLEKIKKTKTNSIKKNVSESESSVVDYKKMYRDVKTELDKALKENKELKSKIKNTDSKEYDLKLTVAELKKERYSLLKDIEKLKAVNEEMLAKNKESSTALAKIEADVEQMQKDNGILSFRLNAANKRNEDLQQILDNINLEKSQYELEREEKIEELEAIIKKHIVKFQKLHEKIKEQKKVITSWEESSPELLLEKLNEKLTIDNVYDYALLKALTRKYTIIKRFVFSAKHKEALSDFKSKFVLYGWTKRENENFVFKSLSGTTYKINYFVGKQLHDDMPCAVFHNDNNTVDIFWHYETEAEMLAETTIESNKLKKENKNRLTKSYDYEFIGDFRVLVITSENGIRYKNRLQNHGLLATWVDPFEKSPVHVKNLMKTHDVVIMCVEHMPHSVLDGIDEKSDKHQYVTNHNEDNIVARVKFTAKLLDLM